MSEKETQDDGFLKRWSRRKQQEVTEPAIETDQIVPEVSPTINSDQTEQQLAAPVLESEQAVGSEAVAEKILTDEDMPDIETLDKDSDYSPFLSEGVSKELRNMALKKLFFGGKFAIRDGLDDYDDDFTRFEPLGNTVTSDMKFQQRRKERERLAKLEEEERLKQEQQAEETEAQIEQDTTESEPVEITETGELEPGELESEDKTAPDSEQPEPNGEDNPQPPEEILMAGRGKLQRKNAIDNDAAEEDRA